MPYVAKKKKKIDATLGAFAQPQPGLAEQWVSDAEWEAARAELVAAASASAPASQALSVRQLVEQSAYWSYLIEAAHTSLAVNTKFTLLVFMLTEPTLDSVKLLSLLEQTKTALLEGGTESVNTKVEALYKELLNTL